MNTYEDEFKDHAIGKGSIRFPANKPLPVEDLGAMLLIDVLNQVEKGAYRSSSLASI